MDEILIIARQFPPDEGQGAVVRVLKFCKFFPQFGFKPVVVTVNRNPCRAIDPKRLDSLREIAAHTEIHYVPEHPVIRWLDQVTSRKGKLKRVRTRSIKYRLLYLTYRILKAIVSNLYRPVRRKWIYPDPGVFWNRRAAEVCRQIIRERNVRYLLTTSPLNSTHLLGLELKREFDLTWGADFRDAWLGNPLFRTKFPLVNRREEALGRKVLAAADLVTSVNDPIVGLLRRFADGRPGRRFVTIYNGFDEEEANCPPYAFDRRFLNLIHCGIISRERDLSALLEALVLKAGEGMPLRLHLVGTVNDQHCPRYQHEHPELVRIWGVASRSKTMELLKGADLALLVFPDTNFAALSGKIFEYLGSDKRVLGLVPEGIARDFIRRHHLGWCCDAGDRERIMEILDEVHAMWVRGELGTRYPDAVRSLFNRKALTGRVAELLREAAAGDGSR